ncbi:hypothetical protein F4553_008028 [Allocatelliglobosispora scoriae]|uniref:Uncharacterized protein n=1 Tax=Allocatelliglobosispora scoriae TaxID=643052 RepID=A0A841C2L1_9ACTN|nr:hypothetical protein [Allocatelliglobosispora scoriae]MBB5874594.1 hypothetical protein [Allocatelliglobosispora scoriae]
MFTDIDVNSLTGRWARITRSVAGREHTHLVLVERAWLSGIPAPSWNTPPDGSIGMTVFEPNTRVPFTSFHLPADGSYEILAGCAPVAVTRPRLVHQPQLWTDLRCPSGPDCTCLTAAR